MDELLDKLYDREWCEENHIDYANPDIRRVKYLLEGVIIHENRSKRNLPETIIDARTLRSCKLQKHYKPEPHDYSGKE